MRSFARREFAPTYSSRAQSTDFPWKALRSLSEMGLLHLLCPPGLGGPEEPAYVAAGIAVEELAYADFNIANLLIPPMIITYILGQFGIDELQDEWLPGLTAGAVLRCARAHRAGGRFGRRVPYGRGPPRSTAAG